MSETGPRFEAERRFDLPMGFTYVENFDGTEPATVQEYENKQLTRAEPGKYAQNNGTLALVTSEGKIAVWIPKSNPNAPREVPYNKAIENLEQAGYTKADFYVPLSNERDL